MSFESIRASDVTKYIGRPNVLLIDLRSKEDYLKGHIPTAVNIPYDDLEYKVSTLKPSNLLIFYCDRGHISLMAARDLIKHGYQIKSLHGGIRAYQGKLV
ncbi:MAG: rhodanese-like domain-containing protein [Clostridiales bacterium]|jgi:rhodanese-related sulfurtransferase|nr:rhodanese-like domain-containing protein [Bacillota bacterium]NLK04551.1 rhodanese-like domain-containing protein [Clostridiales bacterium]